MKCQYVVKRYDLFNGWVYMNSFPTYNEACEAIEGYKRRHKGDYIIDFDYYEE